MIKTCKFTVLIFKMHDKSSTNILNYNFAVSLCGEGVSKMDMTSHRYCKMIHYVC